MRWSNILIPTLRDDPSDTDIASQKLLVRGGFIRQLAPGIYSYLPLGQRTMHRIAGIIREEYASVGAQEFLLPSLHPAELWQETGRWRDMGEILFRAKDRAGRELCLGAASEEVFTEIARREVRSYRDLPQIWYQIQARFRDESRPKSGLLRLRQSIVNESHSLDADEEGLSRSYQIHKDLFSRIFNRCGLEFAAVEAAPGPGDMCSSEEFMVPMDAGEECAVSCVCGYAASLEWAVSCLPEIGDAPAEGELRTVHTPDRKTIAEIAEFLHVPPACQIKSLVYVVDDIPRLFLVRGDHQLSEPKMLAATGGVLARPAEPEEIRRIFGAEPGSLGPVGVTRVPVYADTALRGRRNLTCGANKDDYHIQGVTPDVHFTPVWTSLRTVEPGEVCMRCGKTLDIHRSTRLGRVAKAGKGFSGKMGATILTAEGKKTPVLMGTYEISLDRVFMAAVELHNDRDGIIWPKSISPFSVILTPVNYRDEVKAAADKLYEDLRARGVDVLLDDRLERPGVKFKDADLIGIPYRVVIGSEKLKQGKMELFDRASQKTALLEINSVINALN